MARMGTSESHGSNVRCTGIVEKEDGEEKGGTPLSRVQKGGPSLVGRD